jgi:hypothetical protein
MMNRRQFLASLVTVPLVAKALLADSGAAKAVVAGDLSPLSTIPIDGWTIHFPDGTVFQFQGAIESLTRTCQIDGLMTDTFRVRPTSPPVITTGPKQYDATISRDGQDIGVVTEIEAPRLSREMVDVTYGGVFGRPADEHATYIPGLKRMGSMSFTVLLEAE